MSSTIILLTVVTLSLLGVVSAIVLYFVAQKFKVFEDPRIDDVEGLLPGANCGGCGYPGCRGMADALVKADDLSSLFCPVGGNETMGKIAHYLGKTVAEKEPRVAVVRCQGSPEHRKPTNVYDGAMSCAISASLYSGDTGCQYGCLGYGDCVSACNFDAIHINLVTKLPEVIDDKCTACGACVTACPKNIIELRRKRPKDRKIFVSCVSMAGAVTFVMALANLVTYFVFNYILLPLHIGYMQTITFILVIAALVQMVEIILKKVAPALYQALGIFLPLITTNCAVLGIALLAIQKNYNLVESVVFSTATALGFGLALVIFAGLRENLELAEVPREMKGTPIALVTAGILAMALSSPCRYSY